ncbi:MAG: hypothetical protein WCJ74_02545 [bacterium]
MVQKIIDALQCLREDLKQHNGQISDRAISEYKKKFDDLVSEKMRPIHKKFKASDKVFYTLTELEFEKEPNMPVFGIRSGYKVHCRKDNARNDQCDPLKILAESLGVVDQNNTHKMVAIELPEDMDISKLSPKEILKDLLKRME